MILLTFDKIITARYYLNYKGNGHALQGLRKYFLNFLHICKKWLKFWNILQKVFTKIVDIAVFNDILIMTDKDGRQMEV